MTDNRTVHLFVRENAFRISGLASPLQLAAIEELAALERNGHIVFHRVPSATSGRVPRFWAEAGGECLAVYTDALQTAILDGILVGKIWLAAALSDTVRAELKSLERTPPSNSWLGMVLADTHRFDFEPDGRPRDITRPFQILRGVTRPDIQIFDPYLLANARNRATAARFLVFLEELTEDGIGKVTLRWREDDTRSSSTRSPESLEYQMREFEGELKQHRLSVTSLKFNPQRSGQTNHFHDRQVIADFVSGDEKQRMRWDITSGIDNLMNNKKEAKVFRTRLIL